MPRPAIKPLFAAAALSLLAAEARAEEVSTRVAVPEAESAWHRLSVEVDPLPFFAHGYSVGVGWRFDHVRISASAFSSDLPGFAVGSGWSGSVRAGASLRAQLYLDARDRGFYAALQLGPVATRYTPDAGGSPVDAYQLVLTPSVGYRWFPFDGGLYLMPAVGVGLAVATWTEGGGYQAPFAQVIAALHVGWEF
ncbi:MAG TPA: hypothetical protein VEJ89_16545 [Myxococcaceae bacterium]|nr:hypothetical protein [Myxococcaceae bacterium]